MWNKAKGIVKQEKSIYGRSYEREGFESNP